MRLHTLRLRAVGPFAAEQNIDFDRLGAGGLFLFEGPTGVGKSTILDALTFALYGGLASESGDAARMRSDFADLGQRPEVQLEFSVRGARRRITRSPEFNRPKKRGTGSTKEKSSVHLERLTDGAWCTESHAKDEVGTLIGELLGLNRAQFRQVVLLPQGEFATFLRAGDDERREVLGRLFGSDLYQRITQALQARAQEASRALLAADSELRARVAAAAEAAGLSTDEHKRLAERPLPDRLAGLATLEHHLLRQERAAKLVCTSAELGLDAARRALTDAQAVVSRVAQRAEAAATLAAARSLQDEYKQRRATLASARRASPLRALLDLAETSAQDVDRLRAAVVAASQPSAPAPEHLSGTGSATLVEHAAQARTEAGELAHLVTLEDQLPGERVALGEAQLTVLRLTEQTDAARARAQLIPPDLEAVREQLSAARTSAAGVPAAAQLLEAVSTQAEAAGRLATAQATVAELRATQRNAKRAFDAAHDHHALLVDQRLADVRGELALRLVSGDPCLVCGSAEHPAPATSEVAGVSAEHVRSAAADRDTARLVLDDAQAAVARAEADLVSDTRMAAGRSVAQWRQRMDELHAQLSVGSAAQQSVAGLEERVSALAAEQQDLGRQLQDLAGQLASARADVGHRANEIATHEAQIEQARGAADSVRGRAAALAARAERCAALASAVQDLSRGLEVAAAATERADAEVRRAGFGDVGQARAAWLSPEELDQLAADMEQWERTVDRAQATVASAELQQVADIDPDQAAEQVVAAGAQVENSEGQARGAQEEATVASQQSLRFGQRLREVQQCAAQRADIAAGSEEVLALDNYARGMAGTPRMSLVTFVLRYWFEQVVAAANLRLQSMSAGKYELLRIDDAARKSDRVGLGLSVLDRHTGRERSPATLSGGESFYTSLSLALGLADVVVAQAGGAQLDTLFIDEGFGSLDPDTLDDVMGVIDDLRGNGRVIGIVSHVPELKERIPERLSVRRTRPDGPSAVVVRA